MVTGLGSRCPSGTSVLSWLQGWGAGAQVVQVCCHGYRVGEQVPKWYKFDDGEVSECKMDDDEEMKNQCFGGEYLGEVFDHMMKR